ncbi:MAG: hypothetical protein AAGE01_06845 [Pseudomonadota bacterium]
MLAGGVLACDFSGNLDDAACAVGFNFETPIDLSGNTGIELAIDRLEGPVQLAFTMNDAAGATALGETTVSAGTTTLTFSELLSPFGTPDLTQINGLLIGFLPDEQPAALTVGRIDLSDNAAAAPPNAAQSSTFFDPARDGEGIQLALLPDGETVVLTWYTYVDGEQLWLIGAGPLIDGRAMLDVVSTTGARFGAAFRPEDVVREPWGRVAVELLDCNRLAVEASPDAAGFDDFAVAMTRLLPADCAAIDGGEPPANAAVLFEFSGTYFDPLRDGEGFQVAIEEDGRTVIVTWYTYADGEPIWLIGAGTVSDARLDLTMTITEGADFGADFDPTRVIRTEWGALSIRFLDCNQFEATASPALDGFEPITLLVEKIIPGTCT